jgi:Holliday junction resolvase RusA-like endonuclease
MTSIEFWVPGAPKPQGSKVFKGIQNGQGVMVESCQELGAWRERVALAASRAVNGAPVLSGIPFTAVFSFVMPRPASAAKRVTPPAVKRPDIDKLSRALCDALTGIVFTDDSAVTTLVATKRLAEIGEPPGVKIHLTAGFKEGK